MNTKSIDPGFAVAPAIVGNEIFIRGDDRPQVFAESHIDRRTIIDSAYAHREKLSGQLTRFLRERGLEIRRYITRRQRPRPVRREPHEPFCFSSKHSDESSEHSEHEHGSEIVWLQCRVVQPYLLVAVFSVFLL